MAAPLAWCSQLSSWLPFLYTSCYLFCHQPQQSHHTISIASCEVLGGGHEKLAMGTFHTKQCSLQVLISSNFTHLNFKGQKTIVELKGFELSVILQPVECQTYRLKF